MIRKTAAGYTVFARTGRKMGTYRTIDQAQVRLGQLEAFKAQRSPLGRMAREGGLHPSPYSKKNLQTDDFMTLQPSRGGWIVDLRGEFMGSVKKTKDGWKLDPIHGGGPVGGRHYDACKRATELLDAYFASGGVMSPTVRAKSKEGRKGYYVRAKSGRSMGWYPTKAEALRRKGQLEANGAKFFKETRGYTRQTSPTGGFKPVRLHENIRSGTLVKVQGKRSAPGKGLSYEPGRVRLLEDARVGGWDVYDVRLADGSDGSIYGFSIVGKKPFAFAHSWPGQPRRHTRQGSPILKEKIKRALAYVHRIERSSTNPNGYSRSEASAHAIAAEKLNDTEAKILLFGLATSTREEEKILAHARKLSVVGHSWPGQPRRHAKAAKRGHRHHARRYSHSPLSQLRRFTRAELIAARGLPPEGRSRQQKYAATTDDFRKRIATGSGQMDVEARRRLGIG